MADRLRYVLNIAADSVRGRDQWARSVALSYLQVIVNANVVRRMSMSSKAKRQHTIFYSEQKSEQSALSYEASSDRLIEFCPRNDDERRDELR